MNPAAVQIQNLSFRHPGQAENFIKDLNLDISSGERFGLFGPNGAGKTTLMHLMTGLAKPQKGKVCLLGSVLRPHDKRPNRLFGYVPQEFSFYQELSPAENLEFFGAWAGLYPRQIHPRSHQLLDMLGLSEVRNKPIHQFSGGMKRRVNLAIGVIHHPQILFLDEPTVGVDVQSRHAIIGYLKQLSQGGTTLIYTSHQLSEAEELCQRIALMDEGKIIAHDDLTVLLGQHRQEGLEGLFLDLTGKAYRD